MHLSFLLTMQTEMTKGNNCKSKIYSMNYFIAPLREKRKLRSAQLIFTSKIKNLLRCCDVQLPVNISIEGNACGNPCFYM